MDEAFDLLGDEIVLAHAKDRDAAGRFVAAGQGVLNYDHYIARLRRINYTGALVLHGLVEDQVATCVSFLRQKMAFSAASGVDAVSLSNAGGDQDRTDLVARLRSEMPNGVGTLNEKPLHAALKERLALPGDRFEVDVDGYVIDIVRGDCLIEIQTRNVSAIKRKLAALSRKPLPAARLPGGRREVDRQVGRRWRKRARAAPLTPARRA